MNGGVLFDPPLADWSPDFSGQGGSRSRKWQARRKTAEEGEETMNGIVYILTNEAMPGLIKIGCTTDDLANRVRGLYTTGVPLAFEVFCACEVADIDRVERKLHDAFDDHRVSKSREFFRLAPERARAALSLAELKEVKLGDKVFATQEDKAEVEAAKRRTRFQFSMIGMAPGTELKLNRDPAITCRTLNEINQVEFKQEKTSLSDAAVQAYVDLGYPDSERSSRFEWTYNGKRLDDIRREIEGKAD